MVIIPAHLNHVAIRFVVIIMSSITILVSGCCCLSDINISLGSVATRLRCGGIFYYRYARNLLLSLQLEAKHSGPFFRARCSWISCRICHKLLETLDL